MKSVRRKARKSAESVGALEHAESSLSRIEVELKRFRGSYSRHVFTSEAVLGKDEDELAWIMDAPKRERRKHELDVAVSIMTIIGFLFTMAALGVSCYQIIQANSQFRDSGPKYAWFPVEDARLDTSKNGTFLLNARVSYGAVVSNTGRTEGTVVAVTSDEATMNVCVPQTDGKGGFSGQVETAPTESVRLAPGESAFIVLTTVDHRMTVGDSFGFSIPRNLVVHGADGRSDDAAYLEDVDANVLKHYRSMRGYDRVMDECAKAMDGAPGVRL